MMSFLYYVRNYLEASYILSYQLIIWVQMQHTFMITVREISLVCQT